MGDAGPRLTALFLAWVGLLLGSAPAWAGPSSVRDIRLWSGPEGTRFVIELSGPVEYDVFPLGTPNRVVVDLANTRLAGASLPDGQGPVTQLRSGTRPGHGLRFVLDVDSPQVPKSFIVGPDGAAGHRLVVNCPARPRPWSRRPPVLHW